MPSGSEATMGAECSPPPYKEVSSPLGRQANSGLWSFPGVCHLHAWCRRTLV